MSIFSIFNSQTSTPESTQLRVEERLENKRAKQLKFIRDRISAMYSRIGTLAQQGGSAEVEAVLQTLRNFSKEHALAVFPDKLKIAYKQDLLGSSIYVFNDLVKDYNAHLNIVEQHILQAFQPHLSVSERQVSLREGINYVNKLIMLEEKIAKYETQLKQEQKKARAA